MSNAKTEPVTRIVLTPMEAHHMTLATNRIQAAQAEMEAANHQAMASVSAILDREGMAESKDRWGLDIDGDNVVIRIV